MNKDELRFYLEADRRALGRPPASVFRVLTGNDVVWRFQVLLRMCEAHYRVERPPLHRRALRRFLYDRLLQAKVQCGFSIPMYTFGPGLSLAHYGTVVVSEHARIGANCRVHVDVNIGELHGAAPRLGNDLYIGPGAKLFGGIVLADGIAVGANAVVNDSFTEPGITIGGIPARKLSDKGSQGLLR